MEYVPGKPIKSYYSSCLNLSSSYSLTCSIALKKGIPPNEISAITLHKYSQSLQQFCLTAVHHQLHLCSEETKLKCNHDKLNVSFATINAIDMSSSYKQHLSLGPVEKCVSYPYAAIRACLLWIVIVKDANRNETCRWWYVWTCCEEGWLERKWSTVCPFLSSRMLSWPVKLFASLEIVQAEAIWDKQTPPAWVIGHATDSEGPC